MSQSVENMQNISKLWWNKVMQNYQVRIQQNGSGLIDGES